MASWKKTKIVTDYGDTVEAQAPYIISASRSTDIPAFYADWFFHRLKQGYSVWTNPFNGVKSYVSYANVRFIVFWSKNPKPLLPYLDYLNQRGINCYIQYTLNDYEQESLEQGVPSLQDRINTFKHLVDKLGKGRVIWRFDPLILTDVITVESLLKKIENIGDQLFGYTEKLVFSFADIENYTKVKKNLSKAEINYRNFSQEDMLLFAERLSKLNSKWGYTLATCGEKIDLTQFGVEHNHCVDDKLIVRFGYKSAELMNFLGAEIWQPDIFSSEPQGETIALDNGQFAVIKSNNKDKGQRLFCGCMKSKDIGQYNTCPHMCEYCYANTSKESAMVNYKMHQNNPHSETIIGK
jgi:DNA repair photolyase